MGLYLLLLCVSHLELADLLINSSVHLTLCNSIRK
jgi:hypothetical protein